jgi:hypothetical protein
VGIRPPTVPGRCTLYMPSVGSGSHPVVGAAWSMHCRHAHGAPGCILIQHQHMQAMRQAPVSQGTNRASTLCVSAYITMVCANEPPAGCGYPLPAPIVPGPLQRTPPCLGGTRV